MSILPEAWKSREALQGTLRFHRISCFNVLGHSRNITPQLPYTRRASPTHSRAINKGLRNHQPTPDLPRSWRAVRHPDSLAFAKERRPLYSITKQIEMLVSTNLFYRSVNKLSSIYSTKISIISRDGRKAFPELNCSWTLSSYLALFHQASCISEGRGKKCVSPLNTGKINFKISLTLP